MKNHKELSAKEKVASLFTKTALKSYTATFGAGYVSGIFGEFVSLIQNKRFNAQNLTNPSFRDTCIISGVQQFAKEISKNTIKLFPQGQALAKRNPFLFGAATGIPMWAITRFFGTPLQNSRKRENEPFKGMWTSIYSDAPYHVIKNGLDQVCADIIFPQVLPKIGSFAGQRAVEGAIAAIVGSGTYLLAWPIKRQLTGQNIHEALKLTQKMFPKVYVKKISYVLSRPYIVKAIK